MSGATKVNVASERASLEGAYGVIFASKKQIEDIIKQSQNNLPLKALVVSALESIAKGLENNNVDPAVCGKNMGSIKIIDANVADQLDALIKATEKDAPSLPKNFTVGKQQQPIHQDVRDATKEMVRALAITHVQYALSVLSPEESDKKVEKPRATKSESKDKRKANEEDAQDSYATYTEDQKAAIEKAQFKLIRAHVQILESNNVKKDIPDQDLYKMCVKAINEREGSVNARKMLNEIFDNKEMLLRLIRSNRHFLKGASLRLRADESFKQELDQTTAVFFDDHPSIYDAILKPQSSSKSTSSAGAAAAQVVKKVKTVDPYQNYTEVQKAAIEKAQFELIKNYVNKAGEDAPQYDECLDLMDGEKGTKNTRESFNSIFNDEEKILSMAEQCPFVFRGVSLRLREDQAFKDKLEQKELSLRGFKSIYDDILKPQSSSKSTSSAGAAAAADSGQAKAKKKQDVGAAAADSGQVKTKKKEDVRSSHARQQPSNQAWREELGGLLPLIGRNEAEIITNAHQIVDLMVGHLKELEKKGVRDFDTIMADIDAWVESLGDQLANDYGGDDASIGAFMLTFYDKSCASLFTKLSAFGITKADCVGRLFN